MHFHYANFKKEAHFHTRNWWHNEFSIWSCKKKVDAFLEKMPISCEKRIRSIKKLSKVRKCDAENQQKIAFNTLSCEKASFHQYHHFNEEKRHFSVFSKMMTSIKLIYFDSVASLFNKLYGKRLSEKLKGNEILKPFS